MQMLQAAARKGSALTDREYPMPLFARRCAQVRHALDKAVARRARRTAEAFTLPALEPDAAPGTDPQLELPPGVTPALAPAEDAIETKWGCTLTNLTWVPLLPRSASVIDALIWTRHPKFATAKTDPATAQCVLQSIEHVLFDRLPPGAAPLDAGEVTAVEAVVAQYREVLKGHLQALVEAEAGEWRGGLRVELLSRELLVAWAAYCLVHRSVHAQYSHVGGYGAAVDWRDLRHLVLSEAEAQTAAIHVCEYLRSLR